VNSKKRLVTQCGMICCIGQNTFVKIAYKLFCIDLIIHTQYLHQHLSQTQDCPFKHHCMINSSSQRVGPDLKMISMSVIGWQTAGEKKKNNAKCNYQNITG